MVKTTHTHTNTHTHTFLMLALVDAVKRAVVEAMEKENVFIADRYAVFFIM